MRLKTISYKDSRLELIDQRCLPGKLLIKRCRSAGDVYRYIKTLAVRGAPAIGVFAAYGLYIGVRRLPESNKRSFLRRLSRIAGCIRGARPTAVNLAWALDRMEEAALANSQRSVAGIKRAMLKEARRIHREDELMCAMIGKKGSALIKSGDVILTHCNAGALATSGDGTALSVIYAAKRQGKRIKVYADETRPLLQGARLTAWELRRNRVDVTLICDSMPAALMSQGKISKVIVGADRIAANGDFANKIGTYGLAVLAKEHGIPFYVAAPSSTFDFTIRSGRSIPIEERCPDEVRGFAGRPTAPKGVKAYNPAFDVTPNRFASAIITEKGVFRRPYKKSLRRLLPQ